MPDGSLNGPEDEKCLFEHGEEIVRLIESKTGRIIFLSSVPKKKAGYYNHQLRIKLNDGKLQYRVRETNGGDQIDYPGDVAAYTATIETIRVLLKVAVSEDAFIITADIEDFYLAIPLDRPENMRISVKHIPLNIQKRYDMEQYIINGYVVMEINNAVYGLPQAGKFSQGKLVIHLEKHDYIQCPNTACLFKHKSNKVVFLL